MKLKVLLSLILSSVLLVSCSKDPQSGASESAPDSKPTHVWSEQTQTIDKAKAVNQMLIDSAASRREQMEVEGQ